MANVRKVTKGKHKGKWVARVTRVCRDGRRRERKAYRATRRAARVEIPRLLAELGTETRPTRMRFAEFAAQWYEQARGTRKPSTMHGYATVLTVHLIPELGGYWVDDLRPADIAAYVLRKRSQVSDATVRNHLRLLRVLAKDAADNGYCERLFTGNVRTPRVRAPYTDDAPGLLSSEEVGKMLEHTEANWRAVTLLLVFTGLRWCEVSALRWDDLDRERGELRIRRAQVRGITDTTKNEGSTRRVPLAPEVLAELDAHRRALVMHQHPSLRTGWMFANRRGELYRSWPLTKPLRRALKNAGVKTDITTHGLRRTFADLGRRVSDRTIVKCQRSLKTAGHWTGVECAAWPTQAVKFLRGLVA